MLITRHLALFSLAALLGLSACSGDKPAAAPASPVSNGAKKNTKSDEPDLSPLSDATSSGNIYFDEALTPKERGAFVNAMDYLDHSGMRNADPSLLKMMASNGSSANVRAWLEDRVQYIVNNDTDGSKLGKSELDGFVYPNPNVYGSPDGKFGVSEDAPQTIMLNVGAALYTLGKQQGFVWAINGDGMGIKLMTSPRTGVLMVGDGLFMSPSKYANFVKIFHLGTLLHEARHSDGNGKTTGFFHSNCTSTDPDMAPYKGKPACDHSNNGPYTIGALATQTFMKSCASCSVTEQNALYGLYLDYKSRVILDGQTQAWDDAPEGKR
jgi:hypothetical protein